MYLVFISYNSIKFDYHYKIFFLPLKNQYFIFLTICKRMLYNCLLIPCVSFHKQELQKQKELLLAAEMVRDSFVFPSLYSFFILLSLLCLSIRNVNVVAST